MRNSPDTQPNDALGPNSPDSRPPTHDGKESSRAGKQPYASEGEDYRAGNLKAPDEKGEGGRKDK